MKIRSLIFLTLFSWAYLSAPVSFATVLSQKDVKIYKQIFEAHKRGQYQKAKNLENTLSNKLLSGYILFDKYFSARYKTSSLEINNFLKKYRHLPISSDVYALGKKKNFKIKTNAPKDPVYGSNANACSFIKRDEPINLIARQNFNYLSKDKKEKAKKISNNLKNLIEKNKLTTALELLNNPSTQKLFNQLDTDIVRTAIAFSFFLKGNDEKALELSKKAIFSSGNKLPLAHWTAGLSSWREKNFSDASRFFETAALHDEGYPLLKSSASFWAARSYLKEGDFEKVGDFLELASEQPRTFYGLLALYMIGNNLENILDEETLIHPSSKVKFSHPALNRFYALKQIGQKHFADKELTALYLSLNDEKKQALIHLARQKNFYKDLSQLAGVSMDTKERYPLPSWKPLNDWKIKKELVFAFVRQESCFNKRARSSVGARGLMQIMPQTGKVIAKMSQMKFQPHKMENESYNLTLGQNYLSYLMGLPAIEGNLIFTAVAYNAGPGNLIKWKSKMNYQDDPLLFIESIPAKETRGFVERIMVNYWIYNSLTKSSLGSLDSIVHGKWPIYQ